MNDNNFTEGSILGKLMKFMLPVLGAQILQAMYGAVDILIVGRFGTTSGISAVSTGSSIINLVTFAVTGLAMGITVLIGLYLGQKKEERIGKVIGGAICFFVVVSMAAAVCLIIFARPLSMLMQAPEEALDLTVTYVRICGGGILFVIAYNVISSIFRGLGNSRLPLLFVFIACIVNIFGDLFLVAGLKMNVAGAALATIMAQAVSVILSLVIIRKQELPFTMTRQDICFNPEIKNFIRVGAPIALQEVLTNLSFLALCAFINRLGLDASSGYGVANKIISFVLLIPGSMMQSISAFVAQNVGAGKEDRAKKTLFTGMGIGLLIGVVVGLGTFLYGDIVAQIFTQDPAVITRAFEYLRGFALEAVVTAVSFSFIGYYNGHGQTLFVMIQGLAQTFLVRLPMSWIMSIQPEASLTNIALAAPVATSVGIVLNGLYFVYYQKKLNRIDAK